MSADLFQKIIGLSEQKAKETAANKKLSGNLEIVIKEVGTQLHYRHCTGNGRSNIAILI
jgi:hypothetical protein